MKRFFLFLCLSTLFVACKKDEPVVTVADNKTVNQWLYDVMSQLYYWNTTLPFYESSSSDPTSYFVTLKNKDDRFSAVFDNYTEISNALNGVSAAEIGFEFQLYWDRYSNNNVIGVVSYVKKGTPAQAAGIQRGDLFRKIKGQQMTSSNYSTVIEYLFDTSTSTSITFATDNGTSYVDKSPVTITKAINYQEDPVYLDSVYTIQNKKIGYLVYNFFTNDPGDNTLKYDLKLNTIFGKFKQENITELIVDLRYNHGGAMSSAVHLASMMVPNLTTDMIYAYTQYNYNYINYFNSAEFKKDYPNEHPTYTNFATTIDVSSANKTLVQNIGNNLQRIFFLTGSGTASASEMVINGLKPFLPCVLIGDTTVGKNVGSTLVHDEQNAKNHWATMPIILKYFNKDHKSDFTDGFAPDFLVRDNESYLLGDINEAQLAKAISQITGMSTVSASKAPVKQRVFLKSSLDFKLVRNVMIVDKMKFADFNYKLK